ncbi:MAG: hypothetical protein AABW84_02465 [Nanoarchaeota archaeon]
MNNYKRIKYEHSTTAASLYSIIFITVGATSLAAGYVQGGILVAAGISTGTLAIYYNKKMQQSKDLESRVNDNSEGLDRNE